MTNIHQGDFTDAHWLLLVEDSGPDGLGRVLGYFVFENENDAYQVGPRGACDALKLFEDGDIPEDVCTEVLTYGDFKESYGNRMQLTNRGMELVK